MTIALTSAVAGLTMNQDFGLSPSEFGSGADVFP